MRIKVSRMLPMISPMIFPVFGDTPKFRPASLKNMGRAMMEKNVSKASCRANFDLNIKSPLDLILLLL